MIVPTPLKKYEFVRLDHHRNYWGKLKKWSKPPTRYYSYSSIMLDEVINQVLSTEGLFLGQNQSWKPPSSSSFLKGAQPPWHTSTRFDSWGLLSISLLWLYHAVVQKKRTIHVHHSHYPATTPKAASYLLSVAFSSGCRCCRERTYVSPLQGGAQCCGLAA